MLESTCKEVRRQAGARSMEDLLGLLVPPEFRQGSPIAEAVGRASGAVRAADPATLVLIDTAWRPRTFAVPRSVTVSDARGSFSAQTDQELADLLHENAIEYGLPSTREQTPLSSGAAAALQALSTRPSLPALVLGVPTASPPLLNEFGQALRASAQDLGRRIVVVAVGALARDEQAQHGGQPNPAVARFGQEVISHLDQGRAEQIYEIDGALWIQARPETELGHLSMLLGFTTPDARVEVLGSEASPGVFAAVLAFRAPEPLPPFGAGDWHSTQHPTPQG